MKLTIIPEKKSVVVITPTILSPKIKDAMLSVAAQDYSRVVHMVVIDGHSYNDDMSLSTYIAQAEKVNPFYKIEVVRLAQNTGKNGFYGHRIYAAFPHLVNQDYICFLDEDNWFEPNHVSSLVAKIEEKSAFASFSLRNIFYSNGDYICRDDCESLGKYSTWVARKNGQESYLVDTSSWLFERNWLIKNSQHWHHGWGGDRNFLYNAVLSMNWNESNYWCTKLHTLNYRLDGNSNSVSANFFLQGNEYYKQIYPEGFPWSKE